MLLFLNSKDNPNFNSIKVRLEQTRKAEEEADYTFQFHKGAIRTEYYEKH